MFYRGNQLKEGFTLIVDPKRSDLKSISLGRLCLMRKEDSYTAKTEEQEVVLDILRGSCDIQIKYQNSRTVKYSQIGSRVNPFIGKPTILYLPKGAEYIVVSKSDFLDVVVWMTPSVLDNEPSVIEPKDIVVTSMGRGNWRRDVRLAVGSKVKAHGLIVGETLNPPGNWSSCPPHKHDVQNPPEEIISEEVYLFLTELPQGWGVIRLYTSDQDDAYVVKNNDIITIPRGYHTVVAGPGYRLCYLFALTVEKGVCVIMASYDPDHAWLKNCEPILEELERLR